MQMILSQKTYKSDVVKQRQFYISVLRKHLALKYAQIKVLSVVAWWICTLKLQYVSQNKFSTLRYVIMWIQHPLLQTYMYVRS